MVSVLLVSTALLALGADSFVPGSSGPADRAAYEAARSRVGRDPDSHVRLALWCEAHGLSAERIKHLARAVLLDPTHATARGLLGLVPYEGRWQTPDAVAARAMEDEARNAAMARYAERRARTANTADAHWRLALWCQDQGLEPEARAHLAMTVQLDPGRDAAWKRLGYKKVKGRWVTEEQLAAENAEAEAQKAADKHYRPLLAKWRAWSSEKNPARRSQAAEGLSALTDPRAVPALWLTFASGNAAQQELAVAVLGQIDSPGSSRALAMLAVGSNSAGVRGKATGTLRGRDPRDFVGLLIGLLRDPVKYEVRPVGGPGSPGALFVNGKQFNVQYQYSPPPMPDIPLFPGEPITYDADGLPVVSRFLGITSTVQTEDIVVKGSQYFGMSPAGSPDLARLIQQARSNGANQNVGVNITADWYSLKRGGHIREVVAPENLDVQLQRKTVTPYESTMQIPIGQIAVEYQKAALSAQQQLLADVRELDRRNRETRRWNDDVLQTLRSVTGVDRGDRAQAWQAWWTDTLGYSYSPAPDEPAPTIVQEVPPAYIPAAPGITTRTYQSAPSTSDVTAMAFVSGEHVAQMAQQTFYHACFAAGTTVRTLLGDRAIETIRVGDQVLTQSPETGRLSFQPVVAAYHNKPNRILRIHLDGETVGATPIHRFWKAGVGWTMARDLKPGDTIRAVGGPVRVRSIEQGPIEPVYNLKVAEGQSFFVGKQRLLVHDNSLVRPALRPFDAAPELAAITAPAAAP